MIDPGPSAYEKQRKFEVPPKGQDMLWWHPDEVESMFDRYERLEDHSWATLNCYRCEVRWTEHVSKQHHPRCFCCGKFVQKPMSCLTPRSIKYGRRRRNYYS